MRNKAFWLAGSVLGWLCACQPEPERAAPAPALRKPAAVAAPYPTTPADAQRLGKHLAQQLGLSAEQEMQISQLTLGQAHQEERLWTSLADTARQQLRAIALQYDEQLKEILTASQYRQFVRLRRTQRHRSRAGAAVGHQR